MQLVMENPQVQGNRSSCFSPGLSSTQPSDLGQAIGTLGFRCHWSVVKTAAHFTLGMHLPCWWESWRLSKGSHTNGTSSILKLFFFNSKFKNKSKISSLYENSLSLSELSKSSAIDQMAIVQAQSSDCRHLSPHVKSLQVPLTITEFLLVQTVIYFRVSHWYLAYCSYWIIHALFDDRKLKYIEVEI